MNPENHPSMEELIRSGEIQGRQALEYLRDTNEYFFHGSPASNVDLLEPRQSAHNRQLDGQPAVAVASNIDTVIFRSLIQKGSGWTGNESKMEYLVLEDVLNKLTDQDEGYVYVVRRQGNGFFDYVREGDGGREVRSLQPVKVEMSVATHKIDLPFSNILTFQTQQQLDEYLRLAKERSMQGQQD